MVLLADDGNCAHIRHVTVPNLVAAYPFQIMPKFLPSLQNHFHNDSHNLYFSSIIGFCLTNYCDGVLTIAKK